ncbi:hypothetical protein ACIGYR_08720 [Streptomyces sp. NPDC053076]
MDAMVVRSLLVPSIMRLTGRATWWAPAPLRRFHRRFGLSEVSGTRPGPRGAARPATANRHWPHSPVGPGASSLRGGFRKERACEPWSSSGTANPPRCARCPTPTRPPTEWSSG